MTRVTSIDEQLVRRLLAEQHPELASLPVRAAEHGGNDHRTFRLGDELSVRVPSAPGYVPQVAKEQAWLPRLAPQLPLPVPEVRAVGVGSATFAAPWSIYGWIAGAPASVSMPDDDERFAADLATFLVALRAADAADGPAPGLHSAFRGGPVAHWQEEMDYLIERVEGRERALAAGIWKDALDAPFDGEPVWVHGDVALGNLLVRDGVLAAVLDFGCAAVGDPACDTVPVWTWMQGSARERFRRELGVDDGTWARGRGWAVWKALILIGNKPEQQRALGRHVLEELAAGV